MPDRWFLAAAGRKWMLLGGGVTVGLIGLAVVAYSSSDNQTCQDPDLPEWFDPAYRIGKNRSIIFPKKSVGMRTAEDSLPGTYTEEWLDAHFTHYVGESNAFIWSVPRVRYPSDGKIMAGIKVIVGAQVGELSLVCTLTADGRPENMYLPSALLRERVQGPPPAAADD